VLDLKGFFRKRDIYYIIYISSKFQSSKVPAFFRGGRDWDVVFVEVSALREFQCISLHSPASPPILAGTLEPSKKSFVIKDLRAKVKVVSLEPLELTSAKNATGSA
jgi:hypothetical protein